MKLVLSRRNILSLLHKLEMVGSERTIIKYTEDDQPVRVCIRDDSEVYKDRPAGEMHPETEAFVEDLEQALRELRMKRGF